MFLPPPPPPELGKHPLFPEKCQKHKTQTREACKASWGSRPRGRRGPPGLAAFGEGGEWRGQRGFWTEADVECGFAGRAKAAGREEAWPGEERPGEGGQRGPLRQVCTSGRERSRLGRILGAAANIPDRAVDWFVC